MWYMTSQKLRNLEELKKNKKKLKMLHWQLLKIIGISTKITKTKTEKKVNLFKLIAKKKTNKNDSHYKY